MTKKHAPRGATPALKALEEAGIPHDVSTFEGGHENFGQKAMEALDVTPERIFKTLVIDLSAGKGPKRQLAVACVPVTGTLSLKRAAAAFGSSKATMAHQDDAARSSGYIPGGISPIGQKHPLPTIIDETAQLWDTIFVSGGRRGLDVELAPQDLARVTGASFADVAEL